MKMTTLQVDALRRHLQVLAHNREPFMGTTFLCCPYSHKSDEDHMSYCYWNISWTGGNQYKYVLAMTEAHNTLMSMRRLMHSSIRKNGDAFCGRLCPCYSRDAADKVHQPELGLAIRSFADWMFWRFRIDYTG